MNLDFIDKNTIIIIMNTFLLQIRYNIISCVSKYLPFILVIMTKIGDHSVLSFVYNLKYGEQMLNILLTMNGLASKKITIVGLCHE